MRESRPLRSHPPTTASRTMSVPPAEEGESPVAEKLRQVTGRDTRVEAEEKDSQMTLSSEGPTSSGVNSVREPSMWWPGLLGLVGAAFAQFKINQLHEEGVEIRSKPYWVLGGSITAALVIIFSVVGIAAVSATHKLQHDLQNQLAGGPFSSSQVYSGSQNGNAGSQTGSGSNVGSGTDTGFKLDAQGLPILPDGTHADTSSYARGISVLQSGAWYAWQNSSTSCQVDGGYAIYDVTIDPDSGSQHTIPGDQTITNADIVDIRFLGANDNGGSMVPNQQVYSLRLIKQSDGSMLATSCDPVSPTTP